MIELAAYPPDERRGAASFLLDLAGGSVPKAVNVADSGRRAGGPEAYDRLSGSRSTARPAAAQPVKPTARWATFGNPISRSTSAARAER